MDEKTEQPAVQSPDSTAPGITAPQTKSPGGRLRRVLISGIRMVVVCYVGVCLALVLMENRLIYPGAYNDRPAADAKDFGQIFGITYAANPSDPDSPKLHARVFESDSPTRHVLFLHGNDSHAIDVDDWTQMLGEVLGANVMTPEYRGFDGTDFTPNEASLVDDGRAAMDEFCRRYQIKPNDVVIYGRSLGGGVAAAVAQARGAKAVVLERTFDRLDAVAADKYPIIPIKILIRNHFDSVTRLQAFDGPVLQVHGTTDRLIPITHARNLESGIRRDAHDFIEVPGLGHNDSLPLPVLIKVRDFLDRY